MAKRARKLAAELRSEGWRPGNDIRQTQTWECLCEATGCDDDGHPIEGATADLHLGDDPDGYTIRDLFENLVVDMSGEPVGRAFVNEYFDPRHQRMLLESGGAMSAVDSSAFMGVTGQLLVTQILEPYQKEEYMVRKAIPTYNSPLEQEKWIGLAAPKDPGKNMLLVQEQEPFRRFGFGEQYVQTPITRKEGGIIALTKEAIFFDRTGQIVQQATEIGDLLAFREEQETIGVVIGGTTDPVYYTEKRQEDSAPLTLDLFQQASAGSGARQLSYAFSSRLYPWINDIPDNPLNDYRSLRLGDQYFARTVDPNRGRPIVIGAPFVLAPYTRRMDYMQVMQAANIWKMTQSGLSTSGGLATISPNPLNTIGMSAEKTMFSRLLEAELQAQLSLTQDQSELVWFYGDLARAFKYVVNWPLSVVAAPTNSQAEFEQDIVMQWKASKRGRAAIAEPRAWQRHNFLTQGSAL